MTQSVGQSWWESLRHMGLLLSPQEVGRVEGDFPVGPLPGYVVDQLRRDITRLEGGEHSPSEFVSRIMPTVFGFSTRGVDVGTGTWYRGNHVPPEFTHILVSGESLKPRHIWKGVEGGRLPVFIDPNRRVGIGRSRKVVSDVIQWLRQEKCPLAVVTNGRQWRLVHAGLDFDAQTESDRELWFEEGGIGPQLNGLRQILQPALLDGVVPPLAEAIAASRRGHAELSAILGERVREAVETIVRSHGQALKDADLEGEGPAIYRAAVRVVMRMVVVLFAESRDLLPRSNPIYQSAYGLQGLVEQLNRVSVRSRGRMARRHSAWPRVLALFRLVYEGAEHEAMTIPTYGGELFQPGDSESNDPMGRALHVFETACFDSTRNVMPDRATHDVLKLLTRTRVRIRQGRGSTTTVIPVDFRDLSSEYIGILYEGLLDYELRTAPADDAIIFLAVGNEPALPLSRLEGMEPKQVKALFEKLKDTSTSEDDDHTELEGEAPAEPSADDNDVDGGAEDEAADEPSDEGDGEADEDDETPPIREEIRTRALNWTRTACEVGKLVRKPRGRMTPEKQLVYRHKLDAKARQLVRRTVLPGEWYLVRWGGTRKGSGTFYTRPQLAVPTVQRTLAPLCYHTADGGDDHGDVSDGSGAPPPALRARSPLPKVGVAQGLALPPPPLEERVPPDLPLHVPPSERPATPDTPDGRTVAAAPQGGEEEKTKAGARAENHGDVPPGRMVSCLGCGHQMEARMASFVLLGNPKLRDPPRGRPVVYCPNCRREARERTVLSRRLVEFSMAEAADASWSDPASLAVFGDIIGIPSHPPSLPTAQAAASVSSSGAPGEAGGSDDETAPRGPAFAETLRRGRPGSRQATQETCDRSTPPLPPAQAAASVSSSGAPGEAGGSDDETAPRGPGRAHGLPGGVRGSAPIPPPPRLRPRKPEEILALKVCDPGCGSGSFLVAALRYLTDAVFASLYAHGRLESDADRTMVNLLGREREPGNERLADELIPCRPDDELFEPRLKAVLRRWVVERCIYGVDLDPLAVELCRLALWIETMDRDLPFSFLDHKVKCGNSLVGSWFDQFMHYPAMAWKNRDAGDTGHTNGVHYGKGERTKALKAFVKGTLTPDLATTIETGGGQLLLFEDNSGASRSPEEIHADALAALQTIHNLPVQESAEKARLYRELVESGSWRKLKRAFDAWCAVWFWPADDLDLAPLPSTWHDMPQATAERVDALATANRFFHWELEFPDVFGRSRARPTTAHSQLPTASSPGFDAIIGNPPWDTSKPVSKEFFSNIDPLYRSYGKQEALRRQTALFGAETIEDAWLDYSAGYKSVSQFVKYAAAPWGDPEENDNSSDRFALARGRRNQELHALWRRARERWCPKPHADHPYTHQGGGDINLYKLFLEQGHGLLACDGRMGLIVPSGLYSDHGTGPLRELFLDHCRWEWLFGFENRDKIFPDVDGRFKFNPVIIRKGGRTAAIQTAFMRRSLEDWENADELATPYTREQVVQFSPKSRAILEIQSERDLEVLTKIYANSVLLGDDGPDGWGIKYAREFDMTNDSKLFPPRPVWEEWGYRPDEYSRWIKGPWKPIDELWEELGIDPASPAPLSADVPDDADVARTQWGVRCAQPPYDTLPIPRADIPAGIALSREADAWIREDEIPVVTFTDAGGKPLTIKQGRGRTATEHIITGPAIALPLYEGRMVGQFDFSEKGWVSGKGRTAVWRDIPWDRKVIAPQYLMGLGTYQWNRLLPWAAATFGNEDQAAETVTHYLSNPPELTRWWAGRAGAAAFMDITSATNARTMISAFMQRLPCGNSAPVLRTPENPAVLSCILDSLAFDFVARKRCTGLHLNWFVAEETAVPPPETIGWLTDTVSRLTAIPPIQSTHRVSEHKEQADRPALTHHERLRNICATNAILFAAFGLNRHDASHMLSGCDTPKPGQSALDAKGFWRVDKDKPPEQRLTVLSLVAFHDLQARIDACGGDAEAGIDAFCSQNDGEGWMLPETLRLADYGLGHDERAQHPQPVRECFGPRFYDWQLAQSPEESWRECHLHARNLLGEAGYEQLLGELGSGQSAVGSGEDGGIAYPEATDEPERMVAETPPETDLLGNPIERDLFGNPITDAKPKKRRK